MSEKKSNLVRYGSYTEDAADADASRAATISGNNYYEIEVGENVVRFLPPPEGRGTPFRVTAMHYVDAVPGLNKVMVFACPRVELKVPCPVCQEAERLNKSPSPLDRERAYRISAGLRVYAAVVDRRVAVPEESIKVIAFGKMIHNQLKALRKSTRAGGDFTDPTDKGFDVVIVREGTGKDDTKYTVHPDRHNSPLHPEPDVCNYLIENQPDLEAQVNPVVPEELLATFQAVAMRAAQAGPSRQLHTGPRVGGSLVEQARRSRQSTAADAKAAPKSSEGDDDFVG
jgi:hypothetical protein